MSFSNIMQPATNIYVLVWLVVTMIRYQYRETIPYPPTVMLQSFEI